MSKKGGARARGAAGGIASILDFLTALYDVPIGTWDYIKDDENPLNFKRDRTIRYFEKLAEDTFDNLTDYEYNPSQLSDEEKNAHDYANIIGSSLSPSKKLSSLLKGMPKLYKASKPLRKAVDAFGSSTLRRAGAGIGAYEAQKKVAENVDQSSMAGRALTALTPFAFPHAVNTGKKIFSNTVKNSILKKLDPEMVDLYKKGELNPPITAMMDVKDSSARKWQGYLNNMMQQGGGEKSRIGLEKFLDDISTQITGKKRKLPKNDEAASALVLNESVEGLNDKWEKPAKKKKEVMDAVAELKSENSIKNEDHALIINRINEKFPNNDFKLEEKYSSIPQKKRNAFIKNISDSFGLGTEKNDSSPSHSLQKNDLISPTHTQKVVESLIHSYGDNAILKEFHTAMEMHKGRIPIEKLDKIAKGVNLAINDTTKTPLFSEKAKSAVARALELDMEENLKAKQPHLSPDKDFPALWKQSKSEMAELLSDYPYERQQELKSTSSSLDNKSKNKFVADEYFGTTKNDAGRNVLNEKGEKPLTELASPAARKIWLQEYMHSMGYNNDQQSFSPNKFFNKYSDQQEPMQNKMGESHRDFGTSKLSLEELNKANEGVKGAIKEGLNTSGTASAAEKNKFLDSIFRMVTQPLVAGGKLAKQAASDVIADTVLFNEKGIDALTKKPGIKDYAPTSDEVMKYLRTARNPGTKHLKKENEENNYVPLGDRL